MKFNCGPTPEEKEQARIKKEAQAIRDSVKDSGVWKKVFAWWPVRVGSGDCRWLEYVEERFLVDPRYKKIVLETDDWNLTHGHVRLFGEYFLSGYGFDVARREKWEYRALQEPNE